MVLLDRPRMRGDDGFEPLSSVALAVGRASLRSLYSCECFLKWRSAPGRAQVSVHTGLWPQDWGTAGEALLSALGPGPQPPPFTPPSSTSSGHSSLWLSALCWPYTK